MLADVQTLRHSFELPGLRFEEGPGGLIHATIQTPVCQGEIYLQGAQVTRFQPQGESPVLWLSQHSLWEPAKPIRGGIPICFPWFGPHATSTTAPAHGTARLRTWHIRGTSQLSDSRIGIDLQTEIDDYVVRLGVDFGSSLQMALNVKLAAQAAGALRFEAALHTYLHVGDVRSVIIEGLEEACFLDKMDGGRLKPATGQPIQFTGETDRVYVDTTDTCTLSDPSLGQRIRVRKSGSQSTVIWNPWMAKGARMPDFGADEWIRMVCIETANVGPNALELRPGESHEMNLEIDATRFASDQDREASS